MKDMLTHGGMYGSVHFSAEDSLFYGKIEMIEDLVTFEGRTVDELQDAFKEAVEDYILLCKEAGKEVLKAFKGSFNVRVSRDLHREAYEAALRLGISLNQYVKKAIEDENRTVLRDT